MGQHATAAEPRDPAVPAAVLAALIEDGRLGFEAVTGPSAGAMNGVVLVDGWRAGGPDGARAGLERLWRRASLDSAPRPAQRRPVDGWFGLMAANPFLDVWLEAPSPSP